MTQLLYVIGVGGVPVSRVYFLIKLGPEAAFVIFSAMLARYILRAYTSETNLISSIHEGIWKLPLNFIRIIIRFI